MHQAATPMQAETTAENVEVKAVYFVPLMSLMPLVSHAC